MPPPGVFLAYRLPLPLLTPHRPQQGEEDQQVRHLMHRHRHSTEALAPLLNLHDPVDDLNALMLCPGEQFPASADSLLVDRQIAKSSRLTCVVCGKCLGDQRARRLA